MKFEVTKDWDLVRSVMTFPEIQDALTDDFAAQEEWQPETHPRVSYVGIYDRDRFLGIVITAAHSLVQIELHNALLPHVGWKTRLRAFRDLMDWLSSYGCKRVIGKVPAYNRYAAKFNQVVGMKCIGVNEKSFMKHGILNDEIWFGLSLPLGDK